MVLARGAANIADQVFGRHPRGQASGFLAHLHSLWGYDEPEILHYSNSEFGRLGADAGQAKQRAAWRKILRNCAQLATRAENIEQAIDQAPIIHAALIAAALRARGERGQHGPLLVCQVTRLPQPAAIITRGIFLGPH